MYINTYLGIIDHSSVSVLTLETASFTALLLLLLYRYSKIYNNAKSKLVSTRNRKLDSREIQTLYRTIGLLRVLTEFPSELPHPFPWNGFHLKSGVGVPSGKRGSLVLQSHPDMLLEVLDVGTGPCLFSLAAS